MLFKKEPNSISCKMATVLKKKENKCLIFFFFLSIEVFDIAGFQDHFSYVSKTSPPSTREGSKCTCLVLLCVCVWTGVCILTVQMTLL